MKANGNFFNFRNSSLFNSPLFGSREKQNTGVNGNFFNYKNSSLFSSTPLVSRLFGNRNVGSVNQAAANRAKRPQTSRKNDALYRSGNGNRASVNWAKHPQTFLKDGVLYHKTNNPQSKLYTRHGTLAGVRARQRSNQRGPFYSGQEMLNLIKTQKYDGYIIGYDGKYASFQGTRGVHKNNSKYASEMRPEGEKVYFDPDELNDALGIRNPKRMSVKDNEVRFDSYSYYQFTGKDGRSHRVLSMRSSLSSNTFAGFGNYGVDKEATEYAEFWEDLARGNDWSVEQRYSQKEIRQKLEDAGIQTGFFTVTVGDRSKSYFLSQNKDIVTLYDKDSYDKRYDALTSGKTFQLDKFQPGQTVTVGGKEYVLKDDKSIDIEYGAELY